jgi:hypothetical protein
MAQGYSEKEIREIFDSRIRAGSTVNRYPDLEEAPFVMLLARSKKRRHTHTCALWCLRRLLRKTPV